MINEQLIAERVARGAALLDRHRPGWPDGVDLDALDVGGCCDSVPGQLFGHPPAEEAALGIRNEDLVLYGFDLEHHHPHPASEREIDALAAEWKRVIAERLAGAP